MRVGFVGLGNMGWPMAANIARAGHELYAHDLDTSRAPRFAAEFSSLKVQPAATLADLEAAEIVVTMLPNGFIVRDVYLGQGGLAQVLRRGSIAIDMSSADPPGTRTLGAALAPLDITLVMPPYPARCPARQCHTAIMMAATILAALERVKPLLGTMGIAFRDRGPRHRACDEGPEISWRQPVTPPLPKPCWRQAIRPRAARMSSDECLDRTQFQYEVVSRSTSWAASMPPASRSTCLPRT